MKSATHGGLLEGAVVEEAVGPERYLPDQKQLRDEPGNDTTPATGCMQSK